MHIPTTTELADALRAELPDHAVTVEGEVVTLSRGEQDALVLIATDCAEYAHVLVGYVSNGNAPKQYALVLSEWEDPDGSLDALLEQVEAAFTAA